LAFSFFSTDSWAPPVIPIRSIPVPDIALPPAAIRVAAPSRRRSAHCRRPVPVLDVAPPPAAVRAASPSPAALRPGVPPPPAVVPICSASLPCRFHPLLLQLDDDVAALRPVTGPPLLAPTASVVSVAAPQVGRVVVSLFDLLRDPQAHEPLRRLPSSPGTTSLSRHHLIAFTGAAALSPPPPPPQSCSCCALST